MNTAEEKAKELLSLLIWATDEVETMAGGGENEEYEQFVKKSRKLIEGFSQQQTAEVECACGDCLPHGSDLALKMGWRYVEDELTCGNCIAAMPTQDGVKEFAEELKSVMRGRSFDESHLSKRQVVDLEGIIDYIDDELEKAMK